MLSHPSRQVMRQSLGFVGLLLLLIASSPKPSKVVPLVQPSFDFTPPAEDQDKQDISLIFMQPKFDKDFLRYYRGTQPYKSFIENMGTDFVEMLVARGYSYIGPILQYDELVFSQKENAHMVLEVEMGWEMSGLDNALRYTDSYNPLTKSTVRRYFYDGEGALSGRLNMWLSEPFTGEKVWVKAINIPGTTMSIRTERKYDRSNVSYRGDQVVLPESDPLFWNTLVPHLEDIYDKMLKTAWNHLDPVELTNKKADAKKIKDNSTFKR